MARNTTYSCDQCDTNIKTHDHVEQSSQVHGYTMSIKVSEHGFMHEGASCGFDHSEGEVLLCRSCYQSALAKLNSFLPKKLANLRERDKD